MWTIKRRLRQRTQRLVMKQNNRILDWFRNRNYWYQEDFLPTKQNLFYWYGLQKSFCRSYLFERGQVEPESRDQEHVHKEDHKIQHFLRRNCTFCKKCKNESSYNLQLTIDIRDYRDSIERNVAIPSQPLDPTFSKTFFTVAHDGPGKPKRNIARYPKGKVGKNPAAQSQRWGLSVLKVLLFTTSVSFSIGQIFWRHY